MLDKLQNIDRRIVYLLFFIVTTIPFINPIPLSVQTAEYTQATYDLIEKLKPGDVVLIDIRFSPQSAGEMVPPYKALLSHIASRPGVKILWFCTSFNGVTYMDMGIRQVEAMGKAYGKDIVGFGYLAGEEMACAAVAQDLRKAFPMDSRGNRTDSLEAASTVKTAKDLALILQVADGGMGVLTWVRQGYVPFGTKIVSILGQTMIPANLPYYQGKQAAGLISGLQGAAEYEQLLKTPGRGSACLGAQTFGHIYVIILLLTANIAYIIKKTGAPAQPKGGRAR
jgi:hypothetical protein